MCAETATRVKNLETWIRERKPEALAVLYAVDGKEKRGSVSDMLNDGGDFIKVTDGGSLKDLDLILEHIKNESIKEETE